jgi:hypothetical protein
MSEMLIFPTYDPTNLPNVEFIPCRKKPIIVHSAQICQEFRVDTLEGNYKQGKAGDYLMRGIEGELYICDKDIFERTYDIILD